MKIEHIIEFFEWLSQDQTEIQSIYDKANNLYECGIEESSIEQFMNLRGAYNDYPTNHSRNQLDCF